MVWVIVANLAFEFGIVFNNAMLPDLVPGTRVGRWSGWAWSIGYFGGLVALAIALVAFVQTDSPLSGLDKENAEHVRVVGPLVAVWFAIFAWPLFAYTPDRPSSRIGARAAVVQGLSNLARTLRNVGAYGDAARFLLARMIYNDGLTIVFAIGAIFAADNFGMDEEGIIVFGIVLNVTAGLGALGFAWIDDWIGPKRTVVIALAALIVTGIFALVITEVTWFWVVAAAFGTFMGPAQAASRSLMARLAPPEIRTELFGLYAFSGKATAFVGVLVAGAVLDITDNQRAGLATAVVFLAVGLGVLLSVREPQPNPEGAGPAT
jgi:UMF1 family MFS transporter